MNILDKKYIAEDIKALGACWLLSSIKRRMKANDFTEVTAIDILTAGYLKKKDREYIADNLIRKTRYGAIFELWQTFLKHYEYDKILYNNDSITIIDLNLWFEFTLSYLAGLND